MADHEQLPHLETFAKAAERSSFTAAGKALGLTQAAVSQRIQALERMLAVPLFRRRGGRVLLTEAGHRLYDYAQRILALHQEALHEIAGFAKAVQCELSLAASSIPGEHLLPDLLACFRRQHPHVQVRATVADTRQVLHQVEQGQAHLGLVGGKSENPHLEYRRFAGDELVLIVPAEHPWRRKSSVPLAQLLQQGLILREVGSGSRLCFEQALASAGHSLSDLHTVLELGSNEAIKEAVLRGLGLAVLSTHAIQKEVQAHQFYPLSITGLSLTRAIYAVWDRRRVLPIAARQFLELVARNSSQEQSP
jgi:DNA-binding transcriptional LysR family regulator